MIHTHGPKKNSVADELFEYRSVAKKKLKATMAITGAMLLVEVIGGLLTNSLALISDAGHMFTHFFALLISFSAIICANKLSCSRRSFGFYRIEILAALFNSVFLFVITIWILIEGLKRLTHLEPVLSLQMFFIALAGLFVNLASTFILESASHEDINLKSVFLHMWADTLSSIAVIAGAVIIHFTGWNVIDPLLSIIIAILIFVWGYRLFKDSANILLESVPRGVDIEEVRQRLSQSASEIDDVTDLHIWEITSKMYSLTAHIKLKGKSAECDMRSILGRIKSMLNEEFDIEHTTIEFD